MFGFGHKRAHHLIERERSEKRRPSNYALRCETSVHLCVYNKTFDSWSNKVHRKVLTKKASGSVVSAPHGCCVRATVQIFGKTVPHRPTCIYVYACTECTHSLTNSHTGKKDRWVICHIRELGRGGTRAESQGMPLILSWQYRACMTSRRQQLRMGDNLPNYVILPTC